MTPSIDGFGIALTQRDDGFEIAIDPRGRFDLGFRLLWAPGTIRVDLLQTMPSENAFEHDKRAAVLQLDAFEGLPSAVMGEIAALLAGESGWHVRLGPELITLRLDKRPSSTVLRELTDALLALARTSAPATSTEASRLLHGVRTAKEPAHRLYDLRQLAERHPESAATREAMNHACRDPDPRVRSLGALTVGDVAALAGLVHSAAVTYPMRTRALDRLLSLLPAKDRVHLLTALARGQDLTMVTLALDRLATERFDFVALLLELSGRADEGIAAAAIDRLRTLGPVAARFEGPLLALLGEDDTAIVVRLAILEVLAAVGTSACLPELNAFARHGPLRAETRRTVELMRDRLRLPGAGAVSLASLGGEISTEPES